MGLRVVLAYLDPDVHPGTRGIDGMSLALFTEMTLPPNTRRGGLAGSRVNAGPADPNGRRFPVRPLGIMAGIYLAEYGRKSRAGGSDSSFVTISCFFRAIHRRGSDRLYHRGCTSAALSFWAGRVIATALLQVPIVIHALPRIC